MKRATVPMGSPRASLSFGLLAIGLLLGFVPTCVGTDFGGMIAGPAALQTNVLQSLAGREGLRWIRSSTALPAAFGFEAIGDVRLYVPGASPPPESLPEDLLKVYWACRTNLPGPPVGPRVWEVWNEPDFYFVENSAADMMAVLKAAWWGVKSANPESQVLMPSLAFRPSRYALELAHNGLASWTEGWNAHFYGWADDYPAFLAHHCRLREAAGVSGPLWITEIGWMRLPATADEDPVELGRQAAFHERVMVESLLAGVDRHLAFILTPFRDASHELGLTDPAGRWRPAMRSIVEMARRLQGARPRARLVHQATGATLGALLEESDGDWWSVLWLPNRRRPLTLPADLPAPGQGVSSDPAEGSPSEEGSLPDSGGAFAAAWRLPIRWPEGIENLRVGLEGDVSLATAQLPIVELRKDRNLHLRTPPIPYAVEGCVWQAIQPGTAGQRATGLRLSSPLRRELDSLPPVHAPSPVVLRLRPSPGLRPNKPRQTLEVVEAIADGGGVSANLDLYNFSRQPQLGYCELEIPRGWRVARGAERGVGLTEGDAETDRASGHDRRGDPARFHLRRSPNARGTRRVSLSRPLPPLSHVEVPLKIRSKGTRNPAVAPARLKARWFGADGSRDELAVRLEVRRPLPPIRHAFSWREFLPSPGEPDAWQVFELEDHTFTLEVRRPGGNQRDVVVRWALPPECRPNDLFSTTLRMVQAAGPVVAQPFLVTSDGEVWRYGEWEPVGHEGLTWAAQLGDFAPTAWSTHRNFAAPRLAEVRWLVVRFQGTSPGDVIEVVQPALRRDEPTRNGRDRRGGRLDLLPG